MPNLWQEAQACNRNDSPGKPMEFRRKFQRQAARRVSSMSTYSWTWTKRQIIEA